MVAPASSIRPSRQSVSSASYANSTSTRSSSARLRFSGNQDDSWHPRNRAGHYSNSSQPSVTTMSQHRLANDGNRGERLRRYSNARQQPADAMMETLRSVQMDGATTTAQRVHFQQLQRQYHDLYRRAREEAEASLATIAQRQQQALTQQRQQQQEQVAIQQQQRQAQTSPPQHRVYLIDCRSCGAFLTDRGMKAVLLLRPHITLYSTDAMPNCGPLFAPSRTADTMGNAREAPIERTCDCLTQTLACYGCGSAVGYHIVSPCARCTSSVAKHQRSSNGHRTVLHCSEISVRERRYIPGEAGVLCAPPPPSASSRGCKRVRTSANEHLARMSNGESSRGQSHFALPRSPPHRRYTDEAMDEEDDYFDEEDEEHGEDEAYFDPDEDDNEDLDDAAKEPTLDSDPLLSHGRAPSAAQREQSLRHSHEQQYNGTERQRAAASQGIALQRPRHAHGSESVSPTQLDPLLQNARQLRRGDVVFWSDLTPGGERCEPIDSDRVLAMPTAGR